MWCLYLPSNVVLILKKIKCINIVPQFLTFNLKLLKTTKSKDWKLPSKLGKILIFLDQTLILCGKSTQWRAIMKKKKTVTQAMGKEQVMVSGWRKKAEYKNALLNNNPIHYRGVCPKTGMEQEEENYWYFRTQESCTICCFL